MGFLGSSQTIPALRLLRPAEQFAHSTEDRDVPFFKKSNEGPEAPMIKSFLRHHANHRKQSSTRRAYSQAIQQTGLQPALRAGHDEKQVSEVPTPVPALHPTVLRLPPSPPRPCRPSRAEASVS